MTVSVWQLAANYSARNFTKPEEFRPERFLGDPEFSNDSLDVVQPFSVGPRNCIGRKYVPSQCSLVALSLTKLPQSGVCRDETHPRKNAV